MKATSRPLLLPLLLGALLTTTLHAQTSWNSASSGFWHDGANWSAGVPNANGVTISNVGSKTVTVNNDTPTGALSITGLNLTGQANATNTLLLTNTANVLSINATAAIPIDSTAATGKGLLELQGGRLTITGAMPLRVGWSVNGIGGIVMSAGRIETNGGVNLGSYQVGSVGTFDISGGETVMTGALRVAAFGQGRGSLVMTGGLISVASSSSGDPADIIVGANAGSNGSVDVSNGAILEGNRYILHRPVSGSWSSSVDIHDGGVIQFTTNAPVITRSDDAVFRIRDAVVSYRNIANATTSTSAMNRVSFEGHNALRLNSASTVATANYTFDTGLGATNYSRLEMTGTASRWNGTTLTIGANGGLTVFDAQAARIGATTTVNGVATITNSELNWEQNVTLSGNYVSTASLHRFEGDLTLTASGALSGDAASSFVFEGDFTNQSTNVADFSLKESTVRLSGSGAHQFNLSGSAASDDGRVDPGSVAFSIGTLAIDLGNQLVLTGAGGTQALYIGALDLSGWDTGDLTTTLTGALDLSGNLNLYYDAGLAANSYLSGADYDLWSGGKLLAVTTVVPEPSTAALVGFGGLLGLWMSRKRRRA